jgi:hypothetical protein
LWVVYTCADNPCTGSDAQDVWEYFQVDSTVGNRAFYSRASGCALPCNVSGVKGVINSDTKGPNVAAAAQNKVAPQLLAYGVNTTTGGCPAGVNTCDDEFLPTDVWTAGGFGSGAGVTINAGFTDIRPEDARYATRRANGPVNTTTWNTLGYASAASAFFGASILSGQAGSTAKATPVAFQLPGFNDPITGTAVPTTITVIPIGESPIVFITNRTNTAGLGSNVSTSGAFYSNVDVSDVASGVTKFDLSKLFGGKDCEGNAPAFFHTGITGVPPHGNFKVHVQIREPLSGTMNTTEFTTFRTRTNTTGSQEKNNVLVNGVGNGTTGQNPMSAYPCILGGAGDTTAQEGDRTRAIGTGEEVAGVKGTADAIGYTFFSFGNVASIVGPSYGYLTLNGIDPIFESYIGGTDPGQPNGGTFMGNPIGGNAGQLPACDVTGNTAPACTEAAIWSATTKSYPHLRDGTYPAWSLLRVSCDTLDIGCNGTDTLGLKVLIADTQADIDAGTSVPDFLPYADVSFVRQHYTLNSGLHGAPLVNFWNYNGSPAENVAETTPEAGGDAGGCIVAAGTVDRGTANCYQLP